MNYKYCIKTSIQKLLCLLIPNLKHVTHKNSQIDSFARFSPAACVMDLRSFSSSLMDSSYCAHLFLSLVISSFTSSASSLSPSDELSLSSNTLIWSYVITYEQFSIEKYFYRILYRVLNDVQNVKMKTLFKFVLMMFMIIFLTSIFCF